MVKALKAILLVATAASSVYLFYDIIVLPYLTMGFHAKLFVVACAMQALAVASWSVYARHGTPATYAFSMLATGILVVVSLSERAEKVEMQQAFASAQEALHKQAQLEGFCKLGYMEFKQDLKTSKVKYFLVGLVYDKGFEQRLKNCFDIEVVHSGCRVDAQYLCYNDYARRLLSRQAPSFVWP